MSQPNHDAIVLQDEAGHYYVIAAEVLEDAMVSDDAKSAVDADIVDVDGFTFSMARNYEFVGHLSLKSTRPAASMVNGWPCDTPKVAWPCDTPVLKGLGQQRRV
jgi:hypothetical protein